MIDDPSDPTLDEVIAALSRVAVEPVEVSSDRLDALEDRIMSQTEDDRRSVGVIAIAPAIDAAVAARRRWPVWLVAVAAALLTFAVALGVLSNDDHDLVIAAADDVVVVLPDGEWLHGQPGTELPDGSDVQVTGFVDVDGRRYGPGRYRVADGRLVDDSDAATISTGSPRDAVDGSMLTVPAELPATAPRVTTTPDPGVDDVPVPTAPAETVVAPVRTTIPAAATPRPATPATTVGPMRTTTTTTPTTAPATTAPATTVPTRSTLAVTTTAVPTTTSVPARPGPPHSTLAPENPAPSSTSASSTTVPERSNASEANTPPARPGR